MPDGSTRTLSAQFVRAYQGKDPWTFIASTEAVDRYGDIIVADGWDLRNFKKNPIALWQHNASQPIGNWEDVRVEDGALVARLNMVKPGVSSIADMLRGMVENRVLRAVSVGFMPKAMEPITDTKGNPTGGYRFTKSELLEISLVSVPANPEALSVAKSMGVPPQVLRTIFAKTGEEDHGTGRPGLHARPATTSNTLKGTRTMPTLAERITAQEAEIATLRDGLAELAAIEAPTEEQTAQLEQRTADLDAATANLSRLQAAQRALLASARPAGADNVDPNAQQRGAGAEDGNDQPIRRGAAPATIGHRGMKDPAALLFRAAMVIARSHTERRSVDDVLRTNWAGQKDLEAMVRAATDPATVAASAWAGVLVSDTMTAFVEILRAESVFFNVAMQDLTFGRGPIKMPGRSSGTLAGGFVGEGAPIPVKSVAFGSTVLDPCKLGVITPFTREIMMQSDPQLEPLLRNMLIEDTRETIDTLFLDNTAASTGVRPAGLQNLAGANTAASAGTTLANVITDLKGAIAAMDTNKMGRRLTWIMNKQRLLSLSLMTNAAGNFMFKDEIANGTLMGIPVVTSVNVPSAIVFLVDAAELARAVDTMPMIDMSEQATIHMDTAPTALSATGTPNTVAAPVRSLWQTATMALRLLWDISWNQRRSNAVYTITGVGW